MEDLFPNASTNNKKKKIYSFRSGNFFTKRTYDTPVTQTNSATSASTVSLFAKTKTNLRHLKHNLFDRLSRTRTVDDSLNRIETRVNTTQHDSDTIVDNEVDPVDFDETKGNKSKSLNSLLCSKSLSRSSSTPENNLSPKSPVHRASREPKRSNSKLDKRSLSQNESSSNKFQVG